MHNNKIFTAAMFALLGLATVAGAQGLQLSFDGKTPAVPQPGSDRGTMVQSILKASDISMAVPASAPVDAASGADISSVLNKSAKKLPVAKTSVPERRVTFEGQNKENYYEFVSCSESGKHWTVTETEWRVKSTHGQDQYVCEYTVSYDSTYRNCKETNPETNPGYCNCKVVTFKGSSTPTGRCEWQAAQ